MTVGFFHLIIGPMFSGKTTELIRLAERASIAGHKCLAIQYHGDVKRYGANKLASHDQRHIKAIVSDPGDDRLQSTIDKINIEDYTYISIDELQFYSDGGAVCRHLANMGYMISAAGLNGDFKQEPIGCIPDAFAKADKITHITGIDKSNGLDAPFTIRTTGQEDQVVIGGIEMYTCVSGAGLVKDK